MKQGLRFTIPLLFGLMSPGLWAGECVILLHGLARTSDSMELLAETLGAEGYHVANIDYPSREKPIEALAQIAVEAGLADCRDAAASPVNFVTHSLGGILVRQYYSLHPTENLKRVVMLGPPNNGSEVVDNLKDVPGYELINGPAGMQLGTDDGSLPKTLGPVNFALGVIAGTSSINLILSTFLPDPDDGKVSLESTKVEGMCSFIALPTSHPFMMKNEQVIEEVIHFLRQGRFTSPEAQSGDCSFPAEPGYHTPIPFKAPASG
jgi:pimeloyl-ACP methyl ester carboxylesterase